MAIIEVKYKAGEAVNLTSKEIQATLHPSRLIDVHLDQPHGARVSSSERGQIAAEACRRWLHGCRWLSGIPG